jgi:predicted ATP-grasp superfamily ATP-dependent carboligase
LFTRYADATVLLTPPAEDIDRYGEEIATWLRDHPSDVTMASSDQTATALERRRAELERLTALAIPSSSALAVALDKEQTMAAAERVGVPVPRSATVHGVDEVLAAAAEFGYPCVLKPIQSWRVLDEATGVRVVSALLVDEAGARHHAAELVGAGETALVQEYATGRREAITVLRRAGRITASFAMAASRTWPPLGGSSVMRTSIRMPEDSFRHAERLVAEIGYEGYGEVEFRRTADGTPLIMEINPRFSASVELAFKAGVDFARLQLEWARNGPNEVSPGYRVGVRLSWLEGEMRLLANRLVGAPEPRTPFPQMVGSLVRDYLPPPYVDGLDPRDPGPTLHAVAKSAHDALQVVRGRRI